MQNIKYPVKFIYTFPSVISHEKISNVLNNTLDGVELRPAYAIDIKDKSTDNVDVTKRINGYTFLYYSSLFIFTETHLIVQVEHINSSPDDVIQKLLRDCGLTNLNVGVEQTTIKESIITQNNLQKRQLQEVYCKDSNTIITNTTLWTPVQEISITLKQKNTSLEEIPKTLKDLIEE